VRACQNRKKRTKTKKRGKNSTENGHSLEISPLSFLVQEKPDRLHLAEAVACHFLRSKKKITVNKRKIELHSLWLSPDLTCTA
jgi:hypothetical protein